MIVVVIVAILAMVAVAWGGSTRNRQMAFFLMAIFLVFFFSSSTGKKALDKVVPGIAPYIRHPSQIAGIAVPLILGLAAWGLDLVLRADWLELRLSMKRMPDLNVNAIYLIALIPVLISLRAAYVFAEKYYGMNPLPAEFPESIPVLTTASAEWVAPPFGEYLCVPMTLSRGMKLGNTFALAMEGTAHLLPYVEGITDSAWQSPRRRGDVRRRALDGAPERVTKVLHPLGAGTLQGRLARGNIDVDCQTAVNGVLVVTENSTPDWRVKIDSVGTSLLPGQWLSVSAPAGPHRFSFRYRPWDVWVGLTLALVGLVVVIAGFLTRDNRLRSEGAAGEPAEADAAAASTDDQNLN
jgi:hypothetical protein